MAQAPALLSTRARRQDRQSNACLSVRARAFPYAGPYLNGVHGCMGAWVNGCMGAWKHGCMEAWVHGCMGAWVHGCMGAWEHGCMEAWVHGSMGAWVHGWRIPI